MDFEDLKNKINKIEGWLSNKEIILLYKLASRCTGKGVIVEIGSWKGKSTTCLGLGSKEGKTIDVYAIDPHTGSLEHKEIYGKVWTFDEFKKNISEAGLDNVVKPLVMTSEEAAKTFDKPVELVFIDGLHDYGSVKNDFELWSPKIVDEGIIAFHDTTTWQGPKRLVDEAIYKSNNFKKVKTVGSITYGIKTKKCTTIDKIKNRNNFMIKKAKELFISLKA